MIRTLVSIIITLGIILGLSIIDIWYVARTFETFRYGLDALYEKSERKQATYEDGEALRMFWEKKKDTLFVWLPHTAIQEVDYQLNEAVGFLYVNDFENVIPKLEILIAMSENIPQSYTFGLENIF